MSSNLELYYKHKFEDAYWDMILLAYEKKKCLDWVYISNDYEFTASLTAAIDGHTNDTGDILAAFDADGNVRGVSGAVYDPGFGPCARI